MTSPEAAREASRRYRADDPDGIKKARQRAQARKYYIEKGQAIQRLQRANDDGTLKAKQRGYSRTYYEEKGKEIQRQKTGAVRFQKQSDAEKYFVLPYTEGESSP